MKKQNKERFDKIKYNIEYNKKNYKKFACDLKIDEYENISNVLKEYGINKAELVRLAIKNIDKIIVNNKD